MDQALDIQVQCVPDTRDAPGESPVWSAAESALYRVDILGERVHRWHPGTGWQTSWQMPCAAGSIGLRAQGGLVIALRSGFALLVGIPDERER